MSETSTEKRTVSPRLMLWPFLKPSLVIAVGLSPLLIINLLDGNATQVFALLGPVLLIVTIGVLRWHTLSLLLRRIRSRSVSKIERYSTPASRTADHQQ